MEKVLMGDQDPNKGRKLSARNRGHSESLILRVGRPGKFCPVDRVL
jgi:hypothetical protein